MEHEFILIWAILVTITLGILAVFLVKLRKRHDADMDEMEDRLDQKQTIIHLHFVLNEI